jgi:hypothetical protein
MPNTFTDALKAKDNEFNVPAGSDESIQESRLEIWQKKLKEAICKDAFETILTNKLKLEENGEAFKKCMHQFDLMKQDVIFPKGFKEVDRAQLLAFVAKVDTYVDALLSGPRPVEMKPGKKICWDGSERPGTIGALLINDKKEIFILSNSHILVANPWVSDQKSDVSQNGTKVGAVTAYGEMKGSKELESNGSLRNIDAAIAKVDPQFAPTEIIYDHAEKKGIRITGYRDPKKGETVLLIGASTSCACKGIVKTGEPGDCKVDQFAPFQKGDTIQTTLHDTIEIEPPADHTGYLTIEGDSGGLWIAAADSHAVALQVSGGLKAKTAFGVRIVTVMEMLNNKMPGQNFKFL